MDGQLTAAKYIAGIISVLEGGATTMILLWLIFNV